MTCRNRPSPQTISNCFVVLCVRIRRAPLNSDNKRRMSGQISRLAAVSHVLYEREVLELRGENARLRDENDAVIEALKLKLFWKEHSVFMLDAAIVRARRHFAPENSGIWNEWIEPMLQTHPAKR